MAQIHMTLQGKGGVGKSFISALLAQHFLSRGITPHCFDTDPVNQTFGGYAAFKASITRLGDHDGEVNPRFFDKLIEELVQLPDDAVAVIDNGAATFLPLVAYMTEAGIIDLLEGAGHSVYLHTVITGGQALNDTSEGFLKLASSLPDGQLVVWLNEYFGRIEFPTSKGILRFDQTPFYVRVKDRIHALITLPEVRKETVGEDVKKMAVARLTFAEAITSERFGVVERTRLKRTWEALNANITTANF